MKKVSLSIVVLLLSSPSLASIVPDENKIFFHLHQAIHWAELHHQKTCWTAKTKMEEHLSKVKYSQPALRRSALFKYYISVRDLWNDLYDSKLPTIEKLRADLHENAEKLKIPHPIGWQTEFTVCA